MTFENVTANPQANIYFDGKVVSHGITDAQGRKITFGVIFAGKYHFDTTAAEVMSITQGPCEVTLDGSEETKTYQSGESFDVPANSGFHIEVKEGTGQYICQYAE